LFKKLESTAFGSNIVIILQFGDLRSKFDEIRRVRGHGCARASSVNEPLSFLFTLRVGSSDLQRLSHFHILSRSVTRRARRVCNRSRALRTRFCVPATQEKRFFFEETRFFLYVDLIQVIFALRENRKRNDRTARGSAVTDNESAQLALSPRAGFLRSFHTISLKQLSQCAYSKTNIHFRQCRLTLISIQLTLRLLLIFRKNKE